MSLTVKAQIISTSEVRNTAAVLSFPLFSLLSFSTLLFPYLIVAHLPSLFPHFVCIQFSLMTQGSRTPAMHKWESEVELKDNRRQIGAETSEWVETEGLISWVDGKTVSQTERAKCCLCCHYCPVVISPNSPTETHWVTGRQQAHTVNSGNPHFKSASQQSTATCGCSGELVKKWKYVGGGHT